MAGKKGVKRNTKVKITPEFARGFVAKFAKGHDLTMSDAHHRLLALGIGRQISLDAFNGKGRKRAAKKAPAKAKVARKTKATKASAAKVSKAPAKKVATKKTAAKK